MVAANGDAVGSHEPLTGQYGAAWGSVAPVHAPSRRRSGRFVRVMAACASVVLVLVALAATGGQRGRAALAVASQFLSDTQAAIKIKEAKAVYDNSRQEVHKLKVGLTGLETKLAGQLETMDAARDDLVKRIQRVENLPEPVDAKQRKALTDQKRFYRGNTDLASAPLHKPTLLKKTMLKSKIKGIASKIMFPDLDDKEDPIATLEDAVLKSGKKAGQGGGDGEVSEAGKEKELDNDVMDDLKKVVHRHLRTVTAGVEAARTTRDAADAAEHALGYTQHTAAQVGELAKQTEKQADRVVAAAKLTAEARDAMRAALQQSSQIVDYNTHAARAVAQDAGFVTTASSAIAKYLDGIFADRKTVRKVSSAVLARLRSDEKKADEEVERIAQDEATAMKDSKYSHSAEQRSERWSKRSSTAAKTAASAADHALQGEQAALQSGLKALGYARSARDADWYAEEYADEARRAAGDAEDWSDETDSHRQRASDAADLAGTWRERALRGFGAYPSGDFWGPQTARRSDYEMPPWREPLAYPPAADSAGSGFLPAYSSTYPYTPFGTAPYGYGVQGSGVSPLQRAKELVDSVVVLMQHLTRSLEAAGPNCQLVQGYLVTYQRSMASYRAQGVGLGNLLSDEDMKLVEQYAQVQVQSFATDLEDAMANAESYCGLAGGVSLANGVPTVALGAVSSTHTQPYMSVPHAGVFEGPAYSTGGIASPFAAMQPQQARTSARITPLAGMSTPQTLGGTMFRAVGPASASELSLLSGQQHSLRRRAR